jgi:hypothetical protein
MKTTSFFTAFCMMLSFIFVSCNNPKSDVTIMEGTWENYGKLSGMSIYSGKYFIFNAYWKPDGEFKPPLDSAAIIDRFYSMGAISGTFEVQDTIITFTNLYHKDPSEVGRVWRCTIKKKNDNDFHFNIIDKDGKVLGDGDAKRMAR